MKGNKTILGSIFIIGLVSIILAGSYTGAFFSDTETSTDNTFSAGTIDISVDDQNPWTETFSFDIVPGDTKEINFVVKNTGQTPVRVWEIIKNVVTSENGIIMTSEQNWYDVYNGGNPKNDIDSAIVYEMYVNGNLAIAQEAGITISQIKNYYVNLVETLAKDEGQTLVSDGILYPGETVTVTQKYHFIEETENWAQSDIMTFDIEILAQQINAPEPVNQISFIDNKYSSNTWVPTADGTMGVLKYKSTAPNFTYDFLGVGLNPATEYCLIYYADGWPGNHPGALIDKDYPDLDGKLILSDSKDLGMDLPDSQDANYPYGAKIWLVPCNKYNEGNYGVIGWSPDNTNWLFDNWPGLIRYTRGETSEPDGETDTETKTIYLNQLGEDIGSQYGYQHDYTNAANNKVSFTYTTPADGKLRGTMHATGLKPYATYQVKLSGVPTCMDPINGNDQANEYIGYKGRWTCINCSGTAAQRNRNDAQYEAKSPYRGDGSECIAGYLIFDYFTADENGDIVVSDINIATENSYHVLWCGGGVCNTINNANLYYPDSSYPALAFCPDDKVNGEIERFTCGGLFLDPGTYNLKMSLTEESFHQGNWATVLTGDINFEIE